MSHFIWENIQSQWERWKKVDYRRSAACPDCPFCHATYASEHEQRDSVECIMCNGCGTQARVITNAVEERFKALSEALDVDGMQELANMLPNTYYEFEIRARLRYIKRVQESKATGQLELFQEVI